MQAAGHRPLPPSVPSPLQAGCRHIVSALGHLVFPCRVIDPTAGLLQAEALVAQGYGLIILINHFSLRDALQVVCLVGRGRTLRKRPFLAPVAAHQTGALLSLLSGLLGIELQPLVTPDTAKRTGRTANRRLYIAAYLEQALSCLVSGGVLLVAPQGGRRPRLERPKGRPLGILLAEAQRQHVHDIALLFVGLGLPHEASYATRRSRGFNLFRRFDVRVGEAMTVADALSLAGSRRQIDAWAFAMLRRLVPAAYGGKPYGAVPGGTVSQAAVHHPEPQQPEGDHADLAAGGT